MASMLTLKFAGKRICICDVLLQSAIFSFSILLGLQHYKSPAELIITIIGGKIAENTAAEEIGRVLINRDANKNLVQELTQEADGLVGHWEGSKRMVKMR